jgi:IclR family acetate operon transcriptional repressor
MVVRTLSSTLKVLSLCDVIAASDTPMQLADVVRATGEARAAVHQRLLTLVQAGLLERTAAGAYRLALRFQFYAVRTQDLLRFHAVDDYRAVAAARSFSAQMGR